MSGYREEMVSAIAEEQELRKEVGCEEGVQVYGVPDEGTGLKEYLNGPMGAAKT